MTIFAAGAGGALSAVRLLRFLNPPRSTSKTVINGEADELRAALKAHNKRILELEHQMRQLRREELE